MKLEAHESTHYCNGCHYWRNMGCGHPEFTTTGPNCSPAQREDGRNIIWVKVADHE